MDPKTGMKAILPRARGGLDQKCAKGDGFGTHFWKKTATGGQKK